MEGEGLRHGLGELVEQRFQCLGQLLASMAYDSGS